VPPPTLPHQRHMFPLHNGRAGADETLTVGSTRTVNLGVDVVELLRRVQKHGIL
jgi:hypothetical protein